MTTGKVIKVQEPQDAHGSMVAKAAALGIAAPKFRPLCELDGELNMLILANSSIPTARKQGVMSLDLIEKLNAL